MTDRCDRAEPTAMALVGAAHYGTRADIARILTGADLLAVTIWLARAVDPTKSPDELMAWTDPDRHAHIPNGRGASECGQPSYHASHRRHLAAREFCDACRQGERDYQNSRGRDRRRSA